MKTAKQWINHLPQDKKAFARKETKGYTHYEYKDLSEFILEGFSWPINNSKEWESWQNLYYSALAQEKKPNFKGKYRWT